MSMKITPAEKNTSFYSALRMQET